VYKDGALIAEFNAERIVIDTGSRPFIPNVEGIKESKFVYTSETLMEEDKLPKELLVMGGGYIGLEFASYYANFGSKMTIIQDSNDFIPREDAEIAELVYASMTNKGIRILKNTKILKVSSSEDKVFLNVEVDGKSEVISGNALLVATGRRPNINDLHLENTDIQISNRSNIITNEFKETNVAGVFATGDVTNALQFTYISLDDSRIIADFIYGNRKRTINNRGAIPYTVFIDPALSRVGITEKEAIDNGYSINVFRLKVAAIPKARVLGATDGLLKVIVNKEDNLILGAHLFSAESYEVINIIKLAIDNKIPYTVLRDNIYNHLTMSEALNDLFSDVNKK
jgi:probable pyridine nucleotide-disulfide oxidoreductase